MLRHRAWCPPIVGQGFGGWVGARHDFDNCIFDFRELLQVLVVFQQCRHSSHSAMSAAIRRICTGCESSPASSPTRSTSALAVGVVVAIVSAVVVTETVGVVLVFCTGGAPSASDSGNLTRVRSATDCVLVPDVVSRFGVATVSASSGGLTCNLGIGPIKIGSRSLRTFNGLPRVTGVGFHGSRSWRSGESYPTSSLHSAFQRTAANHAFGVPIKCSSVLLSRPSQMPSSHGDSVC